MSERRSCGQEHEDMSIWCLCVFWQNYFIYFYFWLYQSCLKLIYILFIFKFWKVRFLVRKIRNKIIDYIRWYIILFSIAWSKFQGPSISVIIFSYKYENQEEERKKREKKTRKKKRKKKTPRRPRDLTSRSRSDGILFGNLCRQDAYIDPSR